MFLRPAVAAEAEPEEGVSSRSSTSEENNVTPVEKVCLEWILVSIAVYLSCIGSKRTHLSII